MQEQIDLLPIELLRRILQLRSDLCYLLYREYWKTLWWKKMTPVNEEYGDTWASFGDSLISHHEVGTMRNYRNLQYPQLYDMAIMGKMPIYRYYINFYEQSDPYSLISFRMSNFPMMHYFYSLRPEFECKDWFLRFLRSNS